MEMTKAYDTKVLVQELEKVGISGGIETVNKGLDAVEQWLEKSAALSTDGIVGKLDDVAVQGEKAAIEYLQGKLSDLAAKLSAQAPAPAAESAPVETPKS